MVGVTDRYRQRVSGVVGRRKIGKRQDRLHHSLYLVLRGPAGATYRRLDLLRRVPGARDVLLPGGQHDDTASLADRERAAGVLAEIQFFQRHCVRRVAQDQVHDLLVDLREAALGRSVGARLDDAAVQRDEATAASANDAEAGVGEAGVDAEDDHFG